MKKENIIIAIIAFTLGLLLSLNNCSKKPTKTDTKIVTQIEHFRDTIYLDSYITIKSNQSTVKVDENNTYKDSTNRYYNQTFKDSNYTLITYGGKIDSINLTYKCEDMIIYDSTIITNTITKTNTVFKPFKHTLGVDYMYNTNNNVILNYTRNFDRIGISIGTGININNKVPLMKVGLNYSF